ncbi:MAG: hypothetical protein HY270_11345 [Deltaproteobacteria bacterium]|nr:hypothetical protein [Deltaproteobacteria bacterium]
MRTVWERGWTVVPLVCFLSLSCAAFASDPFADAVVSFTPGAHAGFGADKLPGIVLGPPHGGGAIQGSLDTLSLGDGGSIVLRFDPPVICDGPGDDFIVFENAFHAGTPDGPVFAEVGIVAVSQDGEHFVEFPYDPLTFAGLAGKSPVFSSPENGIDPTDPTVAGGDAFDLSQVGLRWVAFVRITDPGSSIADSGSRVPPGDSGGFDLDAMAAVHTCDVGNPTPTAEPTFPLSPTAAPPPTPSATPTATPAVDLDTLAAAIFGDARGDDANGDARISAADMTAAVSPVEGR